MKYEPAQAETEPPTDGCRTAGVRTTDAVPTQAEYSPDARFKE